MGIRAVHVRLDDGVRRFESEKDVDDMGISVNVCGGHLCAFENVFIG